MNFDFDLVIHACVSIDYMLMSLSSWVEVQARIAKYLFRWIHFNFRVYKRRIEQRPINLNQEVVRRNRFH